MSRRSKRGIAESVLLAVEKNTLLNGEGETFGIKSLKILISMLGRNVKKSAEKTHYFKTKLM
jgi:hypothetical protein